MCAERRNFPEMNKPVFTIVARRWWIVVIGLWMCGYYLTESLHPLMQAGCVWARLAGAEKYHRTVREEQMNQAMFHLRYAASRSCDSLPFSADLASPSGSVPLTWRQLIINSMDYSGSHMSGSLIQMFPFLIQPKDPWGNPWVFRVVEVGRMETSDGRSGVDLEMTFGSLGPDGKECPKKSQDYTSARQECDDLLKVLRLPYVHSDLVPQGTPVEE